MVRWIIPFFSALSIPFIPLCEEIKAYVTNQSGASVFVIDEATNTVIKTIPVGSSPTGVEVSPDGKIAYVACENVNRIYVINTATDTVSSTINVDHFPVNIAFTPDGLKAYVTALTDKTFKNFERKKFPNITMVTMTSYEEGLCDRVLFMKPPKKYGSKYGASVGIIPIFKFPSKLSS